MTTPADSGSSHDSSSDDEDRDQTSSQVPQLKPVFVAKSERLRLQEEQALQTKEELQQQRDLEETQQRRELHTRAIVQEHIDSEKREAEELRIGLVRGTKSAVEIAAAPLDDIEMPSDEIPEDKVKEEFESWKIRELARLKRDWLRVNAELLKQAEKDSRRRLTDEEKAEENERLRLERLEQAGVRKGKMQFMQKYYHKGAFFQNIVETGKEEAFKKDFNEAIGVEKVDITLLPKCMQVRSGDFGKRSRSKYTHLKDQDTTDKSAGWNR